MFPFALAVIAFSVVPVSAQKLMIDDIACNNTEVMVAIDMMNAAKRAVEAGPEVSQRIKSGECMIIHKGTRVTVIESNDSRHTVAIMARLVGSTLSDAEMGHWFQYVKVAPHKLWVHKFIVVK
jgi:hypothetical protein